MPAIEFSMSWDFVLRFLSITLIDLTLSGDNAIVIGMAAASVPKHKRRWVILFGGGLAILLRIVLTSIATLLLQVPLLSAIGGCVLFWVAWKLLRIDVVQSDEERVTRSAQNFRQAIILIVTADFMMSLDNVLAVAGSAHGSVVLLIAGLLLSMPLLMTTGGAISMLIDRFKWLVFVGAAVVVFTGSRMILEDKFIEPRLHLPSLVTIVAAVVLGITLPLLFVWHNRRKTGLFVAHSASELRKDSLVGK